MDNTLTSDVVIVGGGVIGCSIAYYLRKAGIGVVVLERGEIGSQASGAAAGLLAPLGPLGGPGPFADLLLASFACFPELVTELEDGSDVKLEYERTGALRVVRNPKRLAHLQKRLQAWQPLGLSLHWLSGDEARRREPLLAPDICAAIYAPQEAQINAARLVQAFAQRAQRLGACIQRFTTVERIHHQAGKVIAVQTNQGTLIHCGYLVVAAGAWTERFMTDAIKSELPIPIHPLAGQMLAAPGIGLRHIVFGEGAYVLPRGDEVIGGATKEDQGFAARVTPEGQQWLRSATSRLVPTLGTSHVERSWAGLRPTTPDTRPLLGPVPGWSNLFLASGHNSVGIMLSPLTGQMLTTCIAGAQVPELIRPFSPERFLPR